MISPAIAEKWLQVGPRPARVAGSGGRGYGADDQCQYTCQDYACYYSAGYGVKWVHCGLLLVV